jgi:hypothetical protein
MKRIVTETPYRPDVDPRKEPGRWLEMLHRNVRYARAAYRYCLVKCDAAPFASHLNYAQPGVLDDRDPEERLLGIEAGLEWARAGGEESWFFMDLGMSDGMKKGEEDARRHGRPVRFMELGPDWHKWLGPTRNRPI